MKPISGYICSSLACLAATLCASGQDTLRVYGPRFGMDVARFAYYFADPSEIGLEVSVDAEVFANVYPYLELGFSSHTGNYESFDYYSSGPYARVGADYNLFPPIDRSEHHAITVGFRYGANRYTHGAEGFTLSSSYWGDLEADRYTASLSSHWFELVGALKTEVAANLFLGWSVRYKVLLNPEVDDQVAPRLIPGYGRGTEQRAFAFSYGIFYKIPLIKK